MTSDRFLTKSLRALFPDLSKGEMKPLLRAFVISVTNRRHSAQGVAFPNCLLCYDDYSSSPGTWGTSSQLILLTNLLDQ